MELLFFVYGHFLKRKEVIYYKDGNKIIVENKIVDKYITSKRYIKSYTMFFNNISDDEFKDLYKNYVIVREKCCLQLDLFFISIMESNAYSELNVVSILQVFDGIFNKLSLFSDSVESYSKDLNDQIIKKINNIDFSDLCNKYNIKINFNEKITKVIASMYLCSFDKKLRKIFKIKKGIIFEKELKKSKNHLHFNNLVEKCKNSRNKISHADDKEEYLKEMENSVYIHKFILTFRMLIISEIGLEKKLNISKLQVHINNLDLYIEKFID